MLAVWQHVASSRGAAGVSSIAAACATTSTGATSTASNTASNSTPPGAPQQDCEPTSDSDAVRGWMAANRDLVVPIEYHEGANTPRADRFADS